MLSTAMHTFLTCVYVQTAECMCVYFVSVRSGVCVCLRVIEGVYTYAFSNVLFSQPCPLFISS